MNKIEVKIKLKNNKLPEGWVKTILADPNLFKTIGSGIYPFNGTKLYLSTSSIEETKIISIEEIITYKKRPSRANMQPRKGLVAFAKMRNTLKIMLVNNELEKNYILSTGFSLFEVKIYPKYFYQYVMSRFFNHQKDLLAEGTTQEAISNDDFKRIYISFPSSLTEQRKIAEILETVDETIEKTGAIIKKYTRIKQSLMQELLTRGIDENGKIRSEETHKFKDSPLGKIPEKWEIVKVKDIGKIEGGYAFKSDSFLLNGKYQVIKIGNLYKGILDLKKNLAYLNTLNEQEKKYTLKHLEILITLTGTIGKKDYGYTVILRHPKKVIFNQRVARIRVINTQNNPIFIFYQTKMEFFLNQFFDNSKGGTGNQTNVSVYDLKKIKILCPPLPEQQRIAGVLSQIDETIEKEQNYKEKLKRLKQGIMEDLLTGKVRVLNVN
mgnify:CR=1 FL=1